MQLPKLNFKEDFVFDIKRDKDTFFIYDMVRKSWLVLTPEEWVRQHFVHYFTQVKKYAKSALILEKKLELNGTIKRIDLLITEKTSPKILVELKAKNLQSQTTNCKRCFYCKIDSHRFVPHNNERQIDKRN